MSERIEYYDVITGRAGAVVARKIRMTNAEIDAATDMTPVGGGGGGGSGGESGTYHYLSEFVNDMGYITAAGVPVKSVQEKRGNVMLDADDVYAVPAGAAISNQDIEDLLTGGNE